MTENAYHGKIVNQDMIQFSRSMTQLLFKNEEHDEMSTSPNLGTC